MKKFTDKYIASLKPEGKMVDIREGEGFGIRVLPSGVKTFFYIYRIDGQRRFLNLGHYDPKKAGKDDASITVEEARSKGVSLGGARKLYTEAKSKVDKGIDPLTEKEQAAATRRNAPTVSDLIDDYIEKHAKKHKDSWKEDQRILNKDVAPVWGKRKAKDITRRDVLDLVDKMQGRGNGIITNTFKIIRRMFRFAVKQEIITVSPCYAFEKGEELPRPVSKERNLSEDEVKAFLTGIDNTAISGEVRNILKLILVTGQRPGEVTAMHSSEISGRWWEFTPKETKVTREIPRKQRIYLTDTALALIGDTTGKSYIFPSAITKLDDNDNVIDDCITERAVSGALRRNLLTHEVKSKPATWKKAVSTAKNKSKRKLYVIPDERKLEIAKFTPHDLRRTCATLISEIGYPDETVDAILAHLKKGEIRTYNQNKYDKEKQAALEAWERKLNSIVSGNKMDNVIPLQRRA